MANFAASRLATLANGSGLLVNSRQRNHSSFPSQMGEFSFYDPGQEKNCLERNSRKVGDPAPLVPMQYDSSFITRYRQPAIFLHWLIALLVFGGYGLGIFMHDLPASPDKLRYFSWHKWIGVTVLWMTLLRASWRMTHIQPPLPPDAKTWQRFAAHITHALLYVLMFAIPVSGWLQSSASGYQTVYLGLLPIPDLVGKNRALVASLTAIHQWLNFGLLALLLLHVVAAVQHHLVKRDDILRRIVPLRGGSFWTMVAIVAGTLFVVTMGSLIALEPSGRDHPHQKNAALSSAPVPTSGDLNAEFRELNVPVTGTFKIFKAASLQFDPENLASAHAEITVDTASFDIGDDDYNAEVRKPEWFDSVAFPQAKFASESVTKVGDGQFQATGQLTIKGKSAPVIVEFRVTDESGKTAYSGTAKLSRSAYGIGDKSWSGTVEDSVTVRFKLLAPKS